MNLDPTPTRVYVIAFLVFVYAFIGSSGVMATLQERMPEPREWLYYIFFALGVEALYFLTFLGAPPVPQEEKQS